MREPSRITDEMERAAKDSSTPLEQRIADTCKWFYYNRDRIPKDNLGKRLEFAEKFIEINIELLALMTDRLQQTEHRTKSERLWLPSGMDLQGDLRRFG